jgi:hypothetical protein
MKQNLRGSDKYMMKMFYSFFFLSFLVSHHYIA